jgi:hypothetical protein
MIHGKPHPENIITGKEKKPYGDPYRGYHQTPKNR